MILHLDSSYLNIEKDKIIIKASFHPEYITIYKTIAGHRWNEKRKVWTFPLLIDTVYRFLKAMPILTLTENASKWLKENSLKDTVKDYDSLAIAPRDYTFYTKPYKHQIIAFNFLRSLKYGGLFLEMGTGKTKVILDIIVDKCLNKEIQKVLIITPNSVLENWKDEINKHIKENVSIKILQGTKKKRQEIINAPDYSLAFYIINYEGLAVVFDELLNKKFDVMVCDESTKIKNASTQRSKCAFALGRNIKYKYLLTGMPITQNYMDIFGQYKFLNHYIFGKSKYVFRQKFCIMGGWNEKEIVGYQNIDDLKNKIFSCSIRLTKKECLDLPKKIFIKRRYDLSPEQSKAYKEMKMQLLTEIKGNIISAGAIISKLMKLSQICSGFLYNEKGESLCFKTNSKLKLLEELLDEILPNKVVIWCHFLEEIKIISALLNKLNICYSILTSRVLASCRNAMIKRFQQDSNYKVLVGTTGTGGMGINLTAASYVIYFSNDYNVEHRIQSQDRTHRIGQKNNVTYFDLIGRKTLEEKILKILENKKNLAEIIMKEGINEVIG